MSHWVNGVAGGRVDHRDRGLQYGDGLFETMRVRRRSVRLLDYHLERLADGCERLNMMAPNAEALRRELTRIAAQRPDAVLKLIVTRGIGPRGYRPSGSEAGTRVISIHPLTRRARQATEAPARLRMCRTRLGMNPALAGLKTLNRLESVLARAEWSDERIWEGLMCDTEGSIVCGTMSNFFMRRGSVLMTPLLDRCGIAGVMRRWVLREAAALKLRVVESRLQWEDLGGADEAFMTNAVAGIVPVAVLRHGRRALRPAQHDTAQELRRRLDLQ
jgi:4-amino-4-deoxychorismate lyase